MLGRAHAALLCALCAAALLPRAAPFATLPLQATASNKAHRVPCAPRRDPGGGPRAGWSVLRSQGGMEPSPQAVLGARQLARRILALPRQGQRAFSGLLVASGASGELGGLDPAEVEPGEVEIGEVPAQELAPGEEGKRRKALVREVLSFALPVLGAVLVEPVLTLVDTYFIGCKLPPKLSVIGLAALAANCALFNLVTTSLSFFCTATTSVVARQAGKDPKAGAKVIANGLFLSTTVGTIVAVVLLAARHAILSTGFHVSPQALTAAKHYLSIRAISVPATLASYVGTGACLGLGDTITPLIGIGAATLTNIVGDWLLICFFKFGVAGAAVATALSSYVGAAVTISILIKKYEVTWRGLPKMEDLLPFLQVSGALLLSTTLAGLTYSGTTRVANNLGVVVDAAAHQIGLQTWWLLSFFGTPLALAAQSIAPRELAAGRPRIARALVNRIFVICLIMSTIIGAVNWAVPTFFPETFTSDTTVVARLQTITKKASIAQVLMIIGCTMDGVYVGCGRLRQYLTAGLGSTAAAWFMLSTGMGIQGAWTAMVWLAASRCAINIAGMPRLFYKLKKAEDNPEVGQQNLLAEDGIVV